MNHAFRLGPVSPGPPASFAYVVALPGGKLEVRYAPTDSQGLMALREAAKGHPLTCAPELAEEAALQMLEVAPLPPELVESKAQLAYELVAGIDRAASRPDATAAFLTAAGKFWSSKAWELIAPEEQLHVAFSVGRSRLQGELSLQAADPSQPRLVLCDEAAALDRLHGLAGDARVAALVKGAGLVVELVKEPAWATAAIEPFFKLPRIPMPERRRAGRIAPTATQDLVLAAALLEAVVAFADLGDGTEAEAVVEAASLRVQARLGPSPLDPASLRLSVEEGLTRVRSGDEPAESRPVEPQPPAPQPAEPQPAAKEPEDDAPLSPAELAALLKGGAAAPEPPAAPAPAPAEKPLPQEDDEAPLSPAELAALLKGGAAPEPAPPVAPEPEPAAAPPESPAANEDDEAPLSPAELAALLKGGAAPAPAATPPSAPAPEASPPAPAPAPVAPPPAAAGPTPVAPAAPEGAPAPAAGVDQPYEPPSVYVPKTAQEPGALEGGWLARTLKSLGSSFKREAGPAAEKPKPAAPPPPKAKPPPPKPKPAPKGAPPARRPAAPPPPPAAPPDPAVPFSAFAQALRIPVPLEPPPVAPAEREQEEFLAAKLAAAAAGRDRFVSFPAVAFQIIDLINAPDADARGVAGFISRDPGLAADVLAVANSVAFRGVSEAGSVREAVARLGLQEVGKVASAVSARALLVPAQAGGRPSTALFTRAVAVATAASATALRLRGAHSDQVWLAGLLHDVGLALGASELHRLGSGGAPGPAGPAAARALERAHVEIGAAALRGWGLPQYLTDICARHHDAAPPAGPDAVDLHLVRLTSALSRLSEPEVAARAAAEIVQSAQALGFDAHAVRALAADLKAAEQRAAVLVR